MSCVKGFISFVFIASSWFAQGAAVNHLLSGTASLTGTSTTVTLCDSVDLTKSVLFFTITNDNNSVGGNLVTGELTNEITATFRRDGSNGTVSIAWQVVEYSSGVTVQRGSTTVSSTTTNQSITAVADLTETFPVISMLNSGSTYGSDDGVIAELTSTTNLQFRCSSSGFDVYWQVVEYDSCSVESFSLSFSGTSSTATISSVTTSKTMIIGSHYQSGNVNMDDLPRTELTNSTTVTCTRVGSSSTITYFGYAIEFEDNTTVQHNSFSFGSSDGTVSQVITTAETDRSIIFGTGNFGVQGSTSYSSDDNVGYSWATMSLASSTSASGTRAATGSAATLPFQVVSFRYDQTDPPASAVDLTDPTGPFDNMYLNRRDRGIVTMASGASSQTVTISEVDVDSTFLLFSARINSNSIGQASIGGEITNSTTLTFYRAGTGTDVIIEWQIFYFREGVWVQHGSTLLNSTSINQSITSVDQTKSFVIANFQNNGSVLGSDDAIVADLNSSTNINFRSGSTLGANAYWQVVQMDDALVRNVQFSLSSGSTSTTSAISAIDGSCGGTPNGVDMDHTFVISNHAINADMRSDDLPRLELTDTNELTATRVGSTGTCDFVAYVVELFDSSTVARGTVSITGTNTSNTATITSVDTFATGVIGSSNKGWQASSDFTTDDAMGYSMVTFRLNSSTQITVERAGSSSSTTIAPYQIITFDNYSSPPLPVTLGSFDAQRHGADVVLDWQTFSEINNAYFEIQRSGDGKVFETLPDRVEGHGTSNEPHSYSYSDWDAPQEDLYYRLKQVDFDGQFEWHPAVLVHGEEVGDEDEGWKVFPNPNNGVFWISRDTEFQGELSICNHQGKEVDQQELHLAAGENFQVNTDHLPGGSYLVFLNDGVRKISFRLAIQ